MADEIRSGAIPYPPSTGNPKLDDWNRQVYNRITNTPLSIFSTSDGPNQSAVTAPQGYLGIEIGSGATKLWFKESGSTSTGWVSVSTQ